MSGDADKKSENQKGSGGVERTAKSLCQQIKTAASLRANVHICGEMGTGKQIAGTLIHRLSDRSADPLVTIDCADGFRRNIWPDGIDGREKAEAAAKRNLCRFLNEIVRGTLILNDISQLGVDLQEAMLKAIQQRPGFHHHAFVCPPDLRIIMISHCSRQTLLRDGIIKHEFFNRLNPVPIILKPLCHCKADIPALANYYFKYYGSSRKTRTIPGSIMRRLLDYDWPGNLYELQNTIQRYLAYNEIIFLHDKSDFTMSGKKLVADGVHYPNVQPRKFVSTSK